MTERKREIKWPQKKENTYKQDWNGEIQSEKYVWNKAIDACSKAYDEAQPCNHVKESKTSASDYLCTVCAEKYKPVAQVVDTQQSNLVPLDRNNVKELRDLIIEVFKFRTGKKDEKLSDYMSELIFSRFSTPSVPSLEQIETELVQSSHDGIKGRYVYLDDALNIVHRLLTNGKEEK